MRWQGQLRAIVCGCRPGHHPCSSRMVYPPLVGGYKRMRTDMDSPNEGRRLWKILVRRRPADRMVEQGRARESRGEETLWLCFAHNQERSLFRSTRPYVSKRQQHRLQLQTDAR